MHFEDASVDFHETGHDKRSRLAAAILGLEGIVERWVVHDIGGRVRLDNRRLEVVELSQACLNVLRYVQRIPSFFPRLKVLYCILVGDHAHATINRACSLLGLLFWALFYLALYCGWKSYNTKDEEH